MKIKEFDSKLNEAISHIKSKDLSEAQIIVSKLLIENNHSPQVHNLLGIIAELSGDLDLAITHYRISCTIDQSYISANKNLQRITSFYYKPMSGDIDFGEMK
jgi:Flp pilus assembly protein TadD